MAIDQGLLDIIRTLVKHRCDVNQAFEDGTPLSLAIRKGGILVRHGGDLNALPALVPLVTTASGSREETLQTLLDMGADPNVEDHDGETPLYIISAVVRDPAAKLTMARILVAKGARVNCQCQDKMGKGETPLHCAFRRLEPGYEFIEFLLKNGADPNIKDCAGRTPLSYAQFRCTPAIDKLLARAAGKSDTTDDRSPASTTTNVYRQQRYYDH